MEDFRNEKSFRWIVREVILNSKLASEESSFVGSTDWPLDVGLDVSGITFVNNHLDTYMS